MLFYRPLIHRNLINAQWSLTVTFRDLQPDYNLDIEIITIARKSHSIFLTHEKIPSKIPSGQIFDRFYKL
jgi:hypothetical protein